MFPKSLIFEETEVRIVPRESIDGRAFYVSRDGKKSCNIMPSGIVRKGRATPSTCANSKIHYDANRKQRYLQYKEVLGRGKHILVSHAVWLAWSGKPIPEGYQIHHLNGITTDNRIENIICLEPKDHRRYDAVQRSLRMSGRLDNMSSDEILSVTQMYFLDLRPLDERMKDEPLRDFDPFIEQD